MVTPVTTWQLSERHHRSNPHKLVLLYSYKLTDTVKLAYHLVHLLLYVLLIYILFNNSFILKALP